MLQNVMKTVLQFGSSSSSSSCYFCVCVCVCVRVRACACAWTGGRNGPFSVGASSDKNGPKMGNAGRKSCN